MAEHLKTHGWEYVVVDIEWYSYDAGSQRDKHQYIPFWEVEMDEYSRLLPCPQRFPSSAGGRGFAPLAEYVHGLGLKFGIHIMRGIPRIAAHNHSKILGTERRANEIASPYSICPWNPDMYGVIPGEEGAQEYYDSLMALYAQWGVDFVKCDDICRGDAESAKEEIAMLHKAIENCGRDIVLSLSPGPALLEWAEHYHKNANMWRITDDFWDKWSLLKGMFARCELWQDHVKKGCYPDCDMLPLGKLGKGFGAEWETNFTKEEQKTMMTLWSMFRSPLMIGAKLAGMDEWTLSLLTNREILEMTQENSQGTQILRTDTMAVWKSKDKETKAVRAALFNLSDEEQELSVSLKELGEGSRDSEAELWELWEKKESRTAGGKICVRVPAHGVKVYRINGR